MVNLVKFRAIDLAVIIIGVTLAVCGELSGLNGLSFSGGALLGAFVFKLGQHWADIQDGGK